jgi:hypothetical protein
MVDNIIVGDTLSITKNYTSGYDLELIIINDVNVYTCDAVEDEGVYTFTIPATSTGLYTHGEYSYFIRATLDATVTTIERGNVTISPGLYTPTDRRSHVKIVLDNINAKLEGRSLDGEQEYSIAGRSIKKIPIPELLQLRDRYLNAYRIELQKEKLKNGESITNNILVRFN